MVLPIAVSVALMAASRAEPSPPRTIMRSGFEEAEGTTDDGWLGTTNAGSPAFSRTREEACEGRFSGKLTATTGDVYARWVYRRPDLFASVKPRDTLRLRFRYMADASLGDALVQINTRSAPGWRQYALARLVATDGEWAPYTAELVVDVVPSGSGEIQLRGTTAETGHQRVFFDDVSLEVIASARPLAPVPFPTPTTDPTVLTPTEITTIECDASSPVLRTAAAELSRFISERRQEPSIAVTSPSPRSAPARGTVVLGTPDDHPLIAQWGREGAIAVAKHSDSVDSYEITIIDRSLVVAGANPRAVLYGVFELEDLWAAHGGLPGSFRSKGTPTLDLRLLHPRARDGFHSYTEADIQFVARTGGNVVHLNHDWMREKTLLSFVPCPEFPDAADAGELERNRQSLRRYLDWCTSYGLGAALWLCELPCQGGPWVPEGSRQAFLRRYPAEVLEDTGTYQGKALCLAHPLVEKAYRGLVRRFLADFPEIDMLLLFSLDSNGEFCDPVRCLRHRGVSKYTQYNRLLALLLEEGRKVKPSFRAFSIGWSWRFRDDPTYLAQLSRLPEGAGLATLPDGEAWSFDRKLTDRLFEHREVTRSAGQAFLGYDIFLWGDDCWFPDTELYDFPLGVAAKLRRWGSLRADGIFDQWGTQAEYVASNAVALRAMLFHPELTEPAAASTFAAALAEAQVGRAAADAVVAAWREIEAAQQIQSEHTYYWHFLRPNWAGPVLKSSLAVDALRACDLGSTEPAKPYAGEDSCPYAGNHIACARALGEALPKVSTHFARACVHLETAKARLRPDHRSLYEHWYRESEDDARLRLTPRQSLEKQLTAVRTQQRIQQQMGWFFAAYAIARSMPEAGKPGHDEAMRRLDRIRAKAGR